MSATTRISEVPGEEGRDWYLAADLGSWPTS